MNTPAYYAGWRAYVRQRDRAVCPYPAGTAEAAQWRSGWRCASNIGPTGAWFDLEDLERAA